MLNALGLLIGVAGLLVLELPSQTAGLDALSGPVSAVSLFDRGEFWMLCAAQAMALGTLGVRSVFALGIGPVVATGWHMILGGLPLLFVSVVREPQVLIKIKKKIC